LHVLTVPQNMVGRRRDLHDQHWPCTRRRSDLAELVAHLISGAVARHRPQDVLVFKIDNWFDHKWLGFSGRVIGQVGVWQEDLTLPPFVANRIVQRWQYLLDEDGDGYRMAGSGPDIHHRGGSAQNLQHRVRQVVPTSALFWFSGNTSNTGRGSLMGYIPVEQEHWSWFLAFVRDGGWKVARRKNIHDYEVRSFEDAAAKSS
jgi:hypothetical protein